MSAEDKVITGWLHVIILSQTNLFQKFCSIVWCGWEREKVCLAHMGSLAYLDLTISI
jgi:hypothetical protein